MAQLKKFEDTERKIAQSENVLLSHGKSVSVDFEEDDTYHLEEHEKGSDNMTTKLHIKRHLENHEEKIRIRMQKHEIETSMIF